VGQNKLPEVDTKKGSFANLVQAVSLNFLQTDQHRTALGYVCDGHSPKPFPLKFEIRVWRAANDWSC
jgi:hypothetical protein